MRGRVVIGANFGDEGKGLMTDYLCQQGAGMVVRFNGGAQAGHTVVRPDGRRHVFQHFGSGSFVGVPTYLSKYFVVNPIRFYAELDLLRPLKVNPVVYAHPDCRVTTFVDMMINQHIENARGDKRHGSVGLGFGETIERSYVPELNITMADLWNHSSRLGAKLKEICTKYAKFRTGEEVKDHDKLIHAFLHGCEKLAKDIHPLGIQQCKDPVFEGAQGLLLDQHNKQFFPHVTRSNTGMLNVRKLCALAGIDDIDAYYVSRTYLTRHGAGPLPEEDKKLFYADDTNFTHEYQGSLRFAPLNIHELRARCAADFGSSAYKLVLTHMDQKPLIERADLYSYGPTYEQVKLTPSKVKAA